MAADEQAEWGQGGDKAAETAGRSVRRAEDENGSEKNREGGRNRREGKDNVGMVKKKTEL